MTLPILRDLYRCFSAVAIALLLLAAFQQTDFMQILWYYLLTFVYGYLTFRNSLWGDEHKFWKEMYDARYVYWLLQTIAFAINIHTASQKGTLEDLYLALMCLVFVIQTALSVLHHRTFQDASPCETL